MYNYIGILNKSSAVSKAITCNFLNSSTSKLNLVLAKGNIIEIYNVTKEGLVSTPYLNVYGKIILLEKIPAGNSENSGGSNSNSNVANSPASDNIFLLTEDLDFSIISFNKVKNEIVNVDKGTVKEDIGKRQDNVHAVFDDNFDYAVISAYKNIFKVVFLRNRSKSEDFSIRYEYEDLMFLFAVNNEASNSLNIMNSNITTNNNNANNVQLNTVGNKLNIIKKDNKTVTILNINQMNTSTKSTRSQTFGMIKVANNFDSTGSSAENRTVKLETFNFNIFKQEVFKDVSPGLDLTSNPTCSLIISPKVGGLIIFYSNYLKYYTISSLGKITEIDTKVFSDRKFITYCEIDKLRFLVVDEFGNLFLLALKSQDNKDFNVIFQFLGEINYASTLTYLDNNFIFVGSEKANSQLIRITKTPTNVSSRPFIEIIEEYDNLAPITDFCLVDNANDEGNLEILCVSGTQKSSCLKTIRKGTNINIEAEIPFTGVKSIFTVSFNNSANDMLIDDENENIYKNVLMFVNFIDRTALVNFDYNNFSISNYHSDNLCLSEPTIFACDYRFENKNYIIQVTSSFIFIYDETLKGLVKIPAVVAPVIVNMKKKRGFLYIYNKNNLLIRYNILEIVKSKSYGEDSGNLFTPEVLSDDILINSLAVSEDMIVFSQWHLNKIFIFSLKTKRTEVLCEFESNLSCPSITFVKNDGIKFLFIALSNGKMLFYKFKTSIAKNLPCYTYTSEDFILKRKYNISNETFEMKKVKAKDKKYLFLSTDLPALLYINKESPSISNFNVKECVDMVNMNLPNLSAFLFKDSIFIGSLSNSQSQNIITKHIGKSIHNLTNITMSSNNNNINLFAFTTEEKREDKNSLYSFVILDKHLNEVSRYNFDKENEVCTTFTEISDSIFLDSDPSNKKLFALGTGIMESTTEEPEVGHICILEMEENFKLKKVFEFETKGAVYKIANRNNLLFVGSCSTLYVYSLQTPNKNSKQYQLKEIRKNNEFTVINDIYCKDNYIIISDIYKSLTVFKFDEEKEKLIECCRDYNPVWCYSLAQVEKNSYLVSDIDGNIFGLRRELQPKSDEEKYKLDRVSQINFGERINKMTCVSKKINTKDWDNIFSGQMKSQHIFSNTGSESRNKDSLNITYFGTLEGSFGIMVSIQRDTFEFLYALQNEILKVITSTGNFEYEKWRAFKDGFVSDFSKGFVEGTILQEFLNFDNQYRVEFLRNMKYPWQKNINETINLIESLLKLH